MKIAIVHDWLVSQRGGENVLDAICELFPKAHLHTLVYTPGSVSSNISRLKRSTSVLQKLPSSEKRYRHFLPLMPWAVEQFDMSEFDLILSSSHCVAKGVKKRPDAFHMSYVHAPMRYMWDRFDEYFAPGRYSALTCWVAKTLRPHLQKWDQKSAERVDHFLANSKFIAAKVQDYYGRNAKVVYPFCDWEAFQRPRNPGKNYLIVTALVPYKRVDLAIEAFNRLEKPLIIVGDGPDRERLEKMAKKNISFVGPLKQESLKEMYSRCKALVFPGIEDFGIVPLEAMAAGSPVIALGIGGALETVTPETGVFFNTLSVESLIAAIEEFESRSFDEALCRKRAKEFTKARFQKEYLTELKSALPTKIWSSLKIAGSGLPQDLL